jgi:hypothetical protein
VRQQPVEAPLENWPFLKLPTEKEKANDVCCHYMSVMDHSKREKQNYKNRIIEFGGWGVQLIVEYICLPEQIGYQSVLVTAPTKTNATWNPKPIIQFTQLS